MQLQLPQTSQQSLQAEDHLAAPESPINTVARVLPFNPIMWGAASNGYTESTEPELVQSPLSSMGERRWGGFII